MRGDIESQIDFLVHREHQTFRWPYNASERLAHPALPINCDHRFITLPIFLAKANASISQSLSSF